MKNNYPKDSVGRLMISKVPIVDVNNTVSEVKQYLFFNIKKLDSINYIYILNKEGYLKGVLSIKELFSQPEDQKISKIMIVSLIKSHPHTDQELVAQLALKHNIKSVPVVGINNKFKGVVLSDDILNIAYQEAYEDIMRLGGVHYKNNVKVDDIIKMPLLLSLKRRLPWLVIGLGGGVMVAYLIGLFEKVLAENIILVAFIPLIVYMASATGTQISFFMVRDLAIKEKINFLIYTWRQFKVVFFISIIVSVLIFFVVFFSYNQFILAFAITIAMFLATLSSIITGLFIPYLASRLRLDPASVSGPIGTIIQDSVTVLIYLIVASILL